MHPLPLTPWVACPACGACGLYTAAATLRAGALAGSLALDGALPLAVALAGALARSYCSPLQNGRALPRSPASVST